jgi:hypothetical protein
VVRSRLNRTGESIVPRPLLLVRISPRMGLPAEWPPDSPLLRSTSFWSFAPRPLPLFFSQSGHSQAELQGGVIMTHLRALVGAGFLLAVPIAWAVVLGVGEAFPEKLAAANLTFLR